MAHRWCGGLTLLLVAITVHSASIEEASKLQVEEYDCPAKIQGNGSANCECNSFYEIKCRNLDYIPVFEGNHVKFNGFYAKDQNIPQLPANIFQFLHVKKISLDFNPIGKAISALAFDYNRDDLEELSLGGCGIQLLPSGLLDGMHNLRHLHLWSNRISMIPNGFFRGTNNLRELLLWSNQISSLDGDTFAGLGELQKLDLDDNQITSVDGDTFRHLRRLQALHLGRNRISNIFAMTFSYLSNLRTLNLNGNNMETIYENSFSGLEKLATLGLQNNSLTFIPAFTDNKKLVVLYLQDNRMRTIWADTFDVLSALQVLDLSRNGLVSAGDTLVRGAKRLSQLYLDQNYLRNLKRSAISKKAKLKTLSLIGNPFECNCPAAWIAELAEEDGTEVWGTCGSSPQGNTPVSISDLRVYELGNCSLNLRPT